MKISLEDRRKKRNRYNLKKKANGHLRLSVSRSNKHISAQVIDDAKGITVASASSLDKKLKLTATGNVEAAQVVGKAVAEDAIKKGVESVVFDRAGYKYHGRVKALADGAREAGLKF